MAKAKWGSGWAHLTPEMQHAFVCQALVGLIGTIDFEDIGSASEDAPKLLRKLMDLTGLCSDASESE